MLILRKEQAYMVFFQYVLRTKKLDKNALPRETGVFSLTIIVIADSSLEIWGVDVLLHDDDINSVCCIVFRSFMRASR